MADIRRKTRIQKYWSQYSWSNIWAMLKNNGAAPKICDQRCEGKLVVITGATSGIGYRTARRYAAGGADLLVINRNPEKSAALCEEIQRDFSVRCDSLVADLSQLDEIHKAANRLAVLERPIDVLIHNAGVYLKKRSVTQDGLETTFVVHYLSSFIMNWILLDKLKRENRARIIYVGSEGYRFAVWGLNLEDLQFEQGGYSGLKAYGSAKTAQLLSMHHFASLFTGTSVSINAMHPGMVATNTGRENHVLYRWFKKNVLDRASQSPDISAEALYYLGIAPDLNGVTDSFFNLTTLEELAPPALDREVADELWHKSLELGRLA
ncbi:MAG: SDR family NAD(P)-dependent oxidoreductase [Anaerolineales bacterium]|uniref:SDR family NAD(P)-dependent oxidoreductase n=1 Tax=Rectinema subterraneum TaxID=2653714 RepID=UPI003C7CC91C